MSLLEFLGLITQDTTIQQYLDRMWENGLDYTEHVCLEISHHLGRVAHGLLVDRLIAQFPRTYPVDAAARHDLDPALPSAAQQLASVAPKPKTTSRPL